MRGDSTKKWKFLIFWWPDSHPLRRLKWNFTQPSGPWCPSALPCLTWIGATSRPCGAKNLIFGLRVNLIPAVCRFDKINVVKYFRLMHRNIHELKLLQPITSPYLHAWELQVIKEDKAVLNTRIHRFIACFFRIYYSCNKFTDEYGQNFRARPFASG